MATRREFLKGAGAAAIATQVPLAPAAASLPAIPLAVASMPAAGTWFVLAASPVMYSAWRVVDAHRQLQLRAARMDLLSVLRVRTEAVS